MPRVVPSQVVEFIKAIFPDDVLQGNTLDRGNAGELRGLVDLVDRIPEELLTMNTQHYAILICSEGHIRERLASWSNDRNSRGALDFIRGQSPVVLIRAALAQCPDESPAPATSELKFIRRRGPPCKPTQRHRGPSREPCRMASGRLPPSSPALRSKRSCFGLSASVRWQKSRKPR